MEKRAKIPTIKVGDPVYVETDKSKLAPQDAFIIVSVNKNNLSTQIQKFPMSGPKGNMLEVRL